MHNLDCSILTQKDPIRRQGVWAALATEQERHLTTGKGAESTKLDFRCQICHSAVYQASCLI